MINKLYLLQFVPLLCFVPLFSPVCCTSQLSATAADYLVREPPRTAAAVNRSEVLDGTGGHRGPALPGYSLLDNAMQQGMNEQTHTLMKWMHLIKERKVIICCHVKLGIYWCGCPHLLHIV